MQFIKQGAIYLAHLSPVKGHEQGGLRPVLVLQNDTLNYNLNTVVIIPLTSNLQAKGLMTTYFLPSVKSGLNKDSIALLYQVRTIDKNRLIKLVGQVLPEDFMEIRIRLTQIFY